MNARPQLARSGADDMLAEPVQGPTAAGAAVAVTVDALLSGFYIGNGPFLPLWNRLPHVTYWLLPSVVVAPAVWLAQHRLAPKLPRHVE